MSAPPLVKDASPLDDEDDAEEDDDEEDDRFFSEAATSDANVFKASGLNAFPIAALFAKATQADIRSCCIATLFSRFSAYRFHSAGPRSKLTKGWFFMLFARFPNRSVESVSISLYDDGLHRITSDVFELPPRQSCKSRVSLLSR